MNNLASERIRLGTSQHELGDRIGVSDKTVSRWEAGISLPGGAALVEMSKLFGCSIDYLLGLTDERTVNNK